MWKKIILCFFLLSFLGCEPAAFEIETKHRIAIDSNNRKQVISDINKSQQGSDIPINPIEKPLLTDVSQDITAPDDSDKEIAKAIVDKLKDILGKQWPVHRESVKFWLLMGVLCLGSFILILHWLIRAINRWLSPDLELGMSFVVVLFVLILVLLIVFGS
jgi:hypothetical protein